MMQTQAGGSAGQPNQGSQGNQQTSAVAALAEKLTLANEQSWMQLGAMAETLLDPDKAIQCYENALKHNPFNQKALAQVASLCRIREQFPKAVEYFNRCLQRDGKNGEIWGALGHCFLMLDELQKAYFAYQQALYHLPNPKDPKLWYGIGILYDRYGSFEHAEEAFTAVLKMDPKFEKSNEIYFRLGIIYKQQQKYDTSLECFRYIKNNPPVPLSEADIYFQIGHVHEQKKEYAQSKEAYEKVLAENPNHAKVLQQLGWLYHQPNTSFTNQDTAIEFLNRSIEADSNDTQTWYLMGRCYMSQQKYNKAFEAYQQAVYRDNRNPTYWCSIGVLYFQISQYRDALDAYSRAIRLNPFISEVWFDLGTLYETCNQIDDSIDAYQKAAELDPTNQNIKQRLALVKNAQTTGTALPPNRTSSLLAEDMHPAQLQPLQTSHALLTQGSDANSQYQLQQMQQQLQQHMQQQMQQHMQLQLQQQQQQQQHPHLQQPGMPMLTQGFPFPPGHVPEGYSDFEKHLSQQLAMGKQVDMRQMQAQGLDPKFYMQQADPQFPHGVPLMQNGIMAAAQSQKESPGSQQTDSKKKDTLKQEKMKMKNKAAKVEGRK